MDRELLLEIGVEALPASWLPGLTAQLADTLKARLAIAGVPLKNTVEAAGTSRRLTAWAADAVAAVPVGRPRRAVHDLASGRRVKPAGSGRHLRGGDLRPPVPGDQRPGRPRDQGPEL